MSEEWNGHKQRSASTTYDLKQSDANYFDNGSFDDSVGNYILDGTLQVIISKLEQKKVLRI